MLGKLSPRFRLHAAEDVGRAAALELVVAPGQVPRRGGLRSTNVPVQHHRLFRRCKPPAPPPRAAFHRESERLPCAGRTSHPIPPSATFFSRHGLILDSRTLQSTPESGARAGYDG